ncbi:MAG TPA: PUA domain-containing protein, partial [Candidatus Thermoplasmatota archaeon]|nr:PUA domain-containing protein [Candidatus Thermoplasmatota archaeon]
TLHDCLDARLFWVEDHDEAMLRRCVRPVEAMAAHLPTIVLRDSAVDAVCHGAPLAVIGIAQLDEGISPGEAVAILTLKGELVALGESAMTSPQILKEEKGIAATSARVVMRKGTYPRTWKARRPSP